MATGYTQIIEERDVTFREFAWRCARAFGAFLHMRDDRLDAPIREPEPSTYHDEAIKKATARHNATRRLSDAVCEERAEKQHRDDLAAFAKETKRRETILARYATLRADVAKWEPPTPEHGGLRDFMLEQIDSSVKWMSYEREVPKKRTGKEWRAAELAAAASDIAYHTEAAIKEAERDAEHARWTEALRQSLGEPQAKGRRESRQRGLRT